MSPVKVWPPRTYRTCTTCGGLGAIYVLGCPSNCGNCWGTGRIPNPIYTTTTNRSTR